MALNGVVIFSVNSDDLSQTRWKYIPLLAVVVVASAMIPFKNSIGLVAITALLLTAVTISGLVSTLPVALTSSIISGFFLNFLFMQPYGSLKINQAEDFVGFISYSTISFISVFSINGWKSSVSRVSSAESIAQQESERATKGERRLTWLNQISHDIRTPLSTVRAVVEDMREDIAYDAPTRQELLHIAIDEIDRLDMLVSNWLMFGSLDSRPPTTTFSAIDVNEVIMDSVRRLSPTLRNNDVQVHCVEHIDQINGNFSEIQHLVMNLLVNAHRHTPADSIISISTRATATGVDIEVSDAGEGFGSHDFDELLKPYVVGERQGSSGLGLSICSEVVRRHLGTIELGKSLHGGGRVTVSIPRRDRRKIS